VNIDSIREYCLSFPHATEKLQWGDALCFKVKGKMFAVLGLDNPRLTFKCTSETFAELIEREDVHPSPYVGRYRWVKLDRLDAVGWGELQDLIRQSYEMVAAKAPGKKLRKKGSVSKPTRLKRKRA
jgi:predicted DNA-binding protein (MmcQ/YjbR family)